MVANLIPEIAQKVETYSATDLVTIIAAFGVLLSAVTTSIVTIISTLRNGKKTDNLTEIVSGNKGLVAKVDGIHALTNSNLTAANNKIDILVMELQGMNEVVRDLKIERDKKQTEEIISKAIINPIDKK